MSFRKFASAAILEAQMGADAGFAKSAHRAVFNYTPREGYLYVRSRAISSRCNDNFDMFPAEEIEKSYLTFIGKPVFVNHHNDDHRRSRGVVIDAALHKDRNPDGSPDTWVEALMEVDAFRFPHLAKAIIAGEVDRTSMGCDVQLSKCSVCGNEATSPLQYCAHIPGKKGKKIYKFDHFTGAKTAQLVFEICSGLSFFENSLLVEAPADPTAFFLGGVELGPGLQHLSAGMNKTASKTAAVPHPYTTIIHPDQTSDAPANQPIRAVCDKCGPVASNRNYELLRAMAEDHQNQHWVEAHDDKFGQGAHEREFPHLYSTRKYKQDRDGSTNWTNFCEGPGCKKRISRDAYDLSDWTSELDNNEEHHEFCSPEHALAHMNKHPEMWDQTGENLDHPSQHTIHDYYRKTVRKQASVWSLLKQALTESHDLIGENEARGNSRPVSEEEFHDLARRGREQYESLAQQGHGTKGLDENWDKIKNHGYVEAQKEWGGATYNAESGHPLDSHADKYALTARPPGMHTVSIPEKAHYQEFSHAMDQARHRYGEILGRKDHHLGVFHDNDKGTIDIDPVLVVHHPKDVETIGAYTHAVGGAYHFKSGDGYFPPHVQGHIRQVAALHPYAWNPEGRTTPYTYQEGADFQRQNFQGNTMFNDKPLNVWSLLKQATASGDDLFDWDFVVQSVRTTDKNPGSSDYKAAKPLEQMTDPEKNEHFHEVGRQAYLQARASGSIKTGNYHPEKKTTEMNDTEREEHFRQVSHVQGIADNWVDKHPVKASNIASSWHESSSEHKQQGRSWYPDANAFSHTAAHLINRHRETTGQAPLSHTQVAGLIGVYSPQAEWHSNLHVALHAGRTGIAVGGGGEASKIPVSNGKTTGAFTSKTQARQAHDILGGMHYDDALAKTSNKVRNFSHLIEHGGDDHHVVVDRHASSVAHGARLPDFVFDHAVMPKLSTKGGYEKYADAYRSATKSVSKSEGSPVQPHMVQAATWLNQQHKNNVDGRRGKNASAAYTKFKDYIGEVYPHDSEGLLRAPGTGHQKAAYGETKSPEDVDTLRSENCTVCGNSSAWDGTQCQVCGYVAPPRPFGDPDTDVARSKDIRKQVLEGTEADPNDPNQQLGQQLGNPEELEDQQAAAAAGEDVELGTLTCNVCGTGIQPAPPTSESGDGEPAYPAEGDVCPVCKKGQLLAEGELGDEAEMDSVDAEEGQEGDAPGGASQQQLEEDDGDETADEEFKGEQDDSDDDDQDDGDSFDPKKKADKSQKTSSWYPSWFTPVWVKR